VHPLLSTALSISSSTYAASKTYIPPFRYVAESAENFTVPVVSAVGRRTGIEDYIRRGLTQHRSSDSADCSRSETKRRKSEKTTNSEEPRQGQLVEVRTNPGWQTRLYYSSTGLATALSDESRRSLRYCLKILFAANANLVKVIETLSTVVEELDAYLHQKFSSASGEPPSGGIAGYLPESLEQRHKRLSETVDRLKDEALKTLKQVVDTISRYAGGALPEQARNVVKRQLLSFPLKWQAAASWTTQTSAATTSAATTAAPAQSTPGETEKCVVLAEGSDTAGGKTKGKAVRVLVMAKEGLDMMRSVAEIVEGTLISADQWCDRIGKARGEEGEQKQRPGAEETEGGREGEGGKKKVHKKTVSWVDGEKDTDGDVAMAKAG
jgi:YD repeat-containing protein